MAVISIRIERKAAVERPARRWSTPRRVGVITSVVVLGAAVLAGIAGASPTTSTTDVTFVTLSAPHKVLSATIAANKTNSPVVIGAATTVPSNATTVRVTVTAKGAKAGTLSFYPAGNPAGASGETLDYPAGNALVSTIIKENVGESGKLTFANAGAGSVVVTATITGYSTQVTAGGINGTGGTAGQVLTNNGSGGATWQTQNFASALTNSVVVHPLGVSAIADGNTLRAAVNSGFPVVVVEPGTYALGGIPLAIPSGVSLMGAGRDSTTITMMANGGITTTGTQTISGVTLTMTAGATNVRAISASGGTLTLEDDAISSTGSTTVTAVRSDLTAVVNLVNTNVSATGSGPFTTGVLVNASTASATINGGTISVSSSAPTSQSFGVNSFGAAVVNGTAITASGTGGDVAGAVAAQAAAGSVKVYGAQLTSTAYAAEAIGGSSARIATSQLTGVTLVTGGGTVACVGAFNASFVALSTACA